MTYKILELDPYLENHRNDIDHRMNSLANTRTHLLDGKDIVDFSNMHKYLGVHKTENGWIYREWADNAHAMFFIGEFNNWQKTHEMKKNALGFWEVFVEGKDTIKHGQKHKVKIFSSCGEEDRIPLMAKRVLQEPDNSFCAIIWDDDQNLKVQPLKKRQKSELIYECHIGMAQDFEGIGSFQMFKENILPRISKLGYTAIQIMGVMQHPYYASFGYHVSNYYAISSWFGNPNDLRDLISACHKENIAVYLDIVHSHAVKNTIDGINMFDGTEGQFFTGSHPHWDSKIFDYSSYKVLWYLLSNLRYYLEDYSFDGFRFDGVTSMLYHHHGIGSCFMSYNDYFNTSTNIPAITYLQLANELVHKINKNAVTVAEDMSGMPGMCLPISDGGIGFDYRLNMGAPDMWVKLVKETADENWDMNLIYRELTSKRPSEKVIGYTESHDQALVGDKTLIFRMADKEMYDNMKKGTENLSIDRAFALFKIMNLATMSTGDGFLNFMGNEFGHPEWIDFPREGNGNSFKYARRQWHLADNKDLKFSELLDFSTDLIKIIKDGDVLSNDTECKYIHNDEKIIAYRKGNFIFILNFHPSYSKEDLFIHLDKGLKLETIFTTDLGKYGGFGRIDVGSKYNTFQKGNDWGFQIYSPSRSAIILQII